MSRPVLLDSSFLIALDRETARNEEGPARRLLTRLRGRRLVVSMISVEEILEGAAQARRCALLQRRASRRLGGNDAWLVATAQSLDADLAGADRKAFERLGERYLRFR